MPNTLILKLTEYIFKPFCAFSDWHYLVYERKRCTINSLFAFI